MVPTASGGNTREALRGSFHIDGLRNQLFFYYESLIYTFKNACAKFQAEIRKVTKDIDFSQFGSMRVQNMLYRPGKVK